MAIGKKKAKKSDEPKKAKKKGTKPAAPKAKGSLLGNFLPAILGVVLVIAGTFGGTYLTVVDQGGREAQSNFATAQAHGYVHMLSQQTIQLQTTLENLVKTERLLTPFQANDKEAIAELEKALKRELPNAASVKILHTEKHSIDKESSPPFSYPQRNLVRRTEKGEEAEPEIHPQGQNRYLSITAPIKEGDEVAGTLFAMFDLKQITDQYPKVKNEWGYLELIQQPSNETPIVFYSSGNAASKQQSPTTIDSSFSHWKAKFYPSVATNTPMQHSTTFYGLAGGAVVLALIFTIVSLVLVKRALTQNATNLASTFNALTSHEKPKHDYSLEIFMSLALTLERLFKEYDSQVRHKALKSQDLEEEDSAPTEGSYNPTYQSDDVLDIDINDDDHSLLDGEDSSDPLAFDDEDPDAMDLDIVDMAESGGAIQAVPQAMPDEIFRAYDIRGIVGQNLDTNITTSIGMAIGSEAIAQGQTAMIVCRDGRNSSPEICEALVQGLLATGINVYDIGMLPTPMLYYATKTLSTQSGVMVTGSHNPADYNGFKVVIADQTLSGNQIQSLKDRIEAGNFSQGQGSYEAQDISQDYKDRILNDVVLAKPMNIVIDCGNGVSGVVATEILNNLGCSVTTLYGEVDGNFPNHHPDPSKPENLAPLIQAVQEQGAEIGIAFDGDGDRLGIVTNQGKIIWPDRLLMLYARDLLSRNPGSDIIYDVKCSRDVAELVSDLGGRAIMNPTGHSLMKAKMAETGAVVGGELSGHIFFNDRWYGFDDAIYSAARLLEILSMEPFDAEQVFAEFPEKVSTPELSIAISEEKKFAIMNRLTEQGQFSDGNMVTLDGIRVDYPDGWGLVRASNTTPNLVARFEADSDESLERIKGIFRQQLQAADASISVDF